MPFTTGHFRPLHLVPLFVATANTIGGTMPLWNPPGALRKFGLPERFALSPLAHTCFVVSGARTSVLGAAIWIFYLRAQLEAVDTLMALLVYVGAVDGYVCWTQGEKRTGLFRAVAGIVIGGWGMLGLTARK